MDRDLTPKQQRFVEEYLIDLNGKQAAIRAGYSEKTAKEQAARLLTNANVQKAFQAERCSQAKRTQVTADRVIEELALIAFADMADFVEVTEQGIIKIKQLDSLPEGASRVIQKIKEKRLIISGKDEQGITSDTLEFSHHDKLKAIELLGKHLGMFSDKVQLSGDEDNPVNINVNYAGISKEELLQRITRHFSGGK